jgi:hypothetical protein
MIRPGNMQNYLSRRYNRKHSPAFRANAALATTKGDKTLNRKCQVRLATGLVVRHCYS